MTLHSTENSTGPAGTNRTSRARRRLSLAMAAASLAALTLPAAIVVASPASAACPINRDCGGPRPPHRPPPTPTPTPPAYSPDLALDVARETTNLAGVRVAGWTADSDLPTSPLQVDIRVDGQVVKTATANQDRPDVGAAFPRYGRAHGFDLTLPISNAAHTISVTSHNVGSGADSTQTKGMDRITGFAANTLDYDLPHALILSNRPDELDRIDYDNGSSVAQQWELDLSGTTVETSGWQDSQNVQVTLDTKVNVGVPVFASGEVEVKVEGSLGWQQNGQVQVSKTWAFKQMTTVPARRRLVASASVSQATLQVPYTLRGSWQYASGYSEDGTTAGVYTGVNAHDMTVKLTETSLDNGSSVTTLMLVSPKVTLGAPRMVR